MMQLWPIGVCNNIPHYTFLPPCALMHSYIVATHTDLGTCLKKMILVVVAYSSITLGSDVLPDNTIVLSRDELNQLYPITYHTLALNPRSHNFWGPLVGHSASMALEISNLGHKPGNFHSKN